MADPAATTHPKSPTNSRFKLIGFVIGAAAITAAIVAVTSNAQPLKLALTQPANFQTWAFLLALPLASLILTALGFHALTNARLPAAARLSFQEMFELIGASWLLNFLPFSPGLFGRIAYQKAKHGITLKDSASVVLESILLSWLAVLLVVPVVYVSNSLIDPLWAVVLLSTFGWIVAARTFGRHSLAAARTLVLLLKLVDQFCWSLRYFLVFRIIGFEPTPVEACLIAAIAQTSMLIPFIGNGLGIREWAVALVASRLPEWFRSAPTTGLDQGLSADLLNRACEVLIAVPVGLICISLLSRRHRTPQSTGTPENPNPS